MQKLQTRLNFYVEGWRDDDAKIVEAGFERKEDALEFIKTHDARKHGYHHWLLRDQAVYESCNGVAPMRVEKEQ